ncbi:aminotransferase class I/II-fold pyridoxal phosphate-dependent enzyme [Fictibacillus aquaticus]|uniref:Aminotransferase n=1 Tax=Fictibacillus aquaticus TaxID=2021314 RepID=A0A235FBG3_9BACL|nr:aminotransferase class I/II-fold pyridoxal phosphate-dependent enzyme [Fictibacillus aquaticus]OYD58720.1 aromatic amino acid aminotransferase [Fictibacillus aquaticus]
METYIQPRVNKIQISGIRQFVSEMAAFPDAISLTLGQPDFETPKHIKEAAKKAIDDNMTVYSPNPGFPHVRRAAAVYVNSKYHLPYNEDEVIITVGASEAIDVSLRTILAEGDEVIIPAPVYPGYEPVITMCGAHAVFVDTTETGFKLTVEMLKKHWSEKTKCVILPYPSNPTGAILQSDELEELASFLRTKNAFVLSDEIYSELTYDAAHSSIASIDGMKEKTIVINGLSKSHSMTGWRIGLLYADKTILQHILKVHQYNVTCANTIAQAAAYEALTAGADDAVLMKNEYRKRRDYCIARLESMGIKAIAPGGAFYIFADIKDYGLPSLSFARSLLSEQKIAVIPGSVFHATGEGYIRLSFAAALPVLETALDRMEEFIQHLKV